MSDVTMRQLLEAGVHFGHQTRFWCPKMKPYIYGHRNKIHIINLERTLTMFNEAMNYLSGVASQRGSIMFVGTKNQAGEIVREQAQRAKSPYVYHRWLGGMLTNYTTVRKSIDRLNELEDIMKSPTFSRISKKEAMGINREHFRLDRNLAGIRNLQGLPDALFVIDVRHEHNAVKEARKLGLPVVAVVDSNCDPDGIDYVIPGNDDAISAIKLFCTAAADAIIAGQMVSSANPVDETDGAGKRNDRAPIAITSARASVAPSREDRAEPIELSKEDAEAGAAGSEMIETHEPAPAADVDQASEAESEPGEKAAAQAESAESKPPATQKPEETPKQADEEAASEASPEPSADQPASHGDADASAPADGDAKTAAKKSTKADTGRSAAKPKGKSKPKAAAKETAAKETKD